MIILYGLLWYGSIGCFLYNFNTFTLAEKLTVILVISGINVLSFINTSQYNRGVCEAHGLSQFRDSSLPTYIFKNTNLRKCRTSLRFPVF